MEEQDVTIFVFDGFNRNIVECKSIYLNERINYPRI